MYSSPSLVLSFPVFGLSAVGVCEQQKQFSLDMHKPYGYVCLDRTLLPESSVGLAGTVRRSPTGAWGVI